MTAPFATASTEYRNMSTSLRDAGARIPETLGQGAFAKHFNASMEQMRSWFAAASNSADDLADICARQAEADALLDAAPSEEEVEAARQRVVEASKALAEGTIEPSELDAAREDYQRLKAKREAALKAHSEACGDTDCPLAEPPCICGEPHEDDQDDQEGDVLDEPGDEGDGTASQSPSTAGAGSSDMGSGIAGDTALTSDTATPTTQQPTLGQPQPAMQPMPQQQPQPAPSAGAAPSWAGQPQSQQLDKRNPDAKLARGAKDKRDLSGIKPSDLDGLLAVPSPSLGSNPGAGAGPIDRGSSVSGVHTERPIEGKGINASTNLSGNTAANPNNPNPNAAGAQGARGMGGMPMGGMGAGAGMSPSAVAKPNILSTQTDPALRDSNDASVQGGMLGRDTSDQPSKVEDEERKK